MDTEHRTRRAGAKLAKIGLLQAIEFAASLSIPTCNTGASSGCQSRGVYFIRTNHKTTSESNLWDIYNTIREVEATFRGLKSDLNIRPVHHQNDSRIDAHLYLTILAYQLVNTIRHMLKNKGISHDWRNIVRIMSTQKIQNIKIPTDKKVIYLRKPSRPINEVQQIYNATSCENTQKPIKKYVVYH